MKTLYYATVLLAIGAARPATAGFAPVLIDFEKTPALPTGSALFKNAGGEQTIDVPGVASISGGVVLGNETNLPALSYATPPNDYGTASASVIPGASNTLQSSFAVSLDPAFSTDEVSFTLLNGMTTSETYAADAYDGATLVASQSFTISANISSGFSLYDLKAPAITSVTIGPTVVSAGWDFSIDSLSLNESIQQAVGGIPPTNPVITPSAVPLPPAAWMGLIGLAVAIPLVKRASRSRRAP